MAHVYRLTIAHVAGQPEGGAHVAQALQGNPRRFYLSGLDNALAAYNAAIMAHGADPTMYGIQAGDVAGWRKGSTEAVGYQDSSRSITIELRRVQ